MEERIPPQDLDAEQSVLGAVMISKDAMATVVDQLVPEDFYRDANMIIFRAVVSLYQKNEPVDLVTVSSELKKLESLDTVGGRAYLAEVAGSVPTASNVFHYAEIVREKSILRRLISTSGEISGDAFEGVQETAAILSEAQRKIMKISQDTTKDDFVKLSY